MLHPKFRSEVGAFFAKRSRKRQDQSIDPDQALFEELLAEGFNNNEFFVEELDPSDYAEMPLSERSKWNPNDPSLTENGRDAAWLIETWEKYVKPKYKTALHYWDKQTGNGAPHPNQFYMYSQGNAWLQWIFLIDKKANFLLACNTKGSMPNHLQMESGVPEDIDGEEVEVVAPRTVRKRKARQVELENELEEAKKIRESIGSVFDKVVVFLDQQNTKAITPVPTTAKKKEMSAMDHFKEAKRITDEMKEAKAEGGICSAVSPDSGQVIIDTLDSQKKYHLEQMKKLAVAKTVLNFGSK